MCICSPFYSSKNLLAEIEENTFDKNRHAYKLVLATNLYYIVLLSSTSITYVFLGCSLDQTHKSFSHSSSNISSPQQQCKRLFFAQTILTHRLSEVIVSDLSLPEWPWPLKVLGKRLNNGVLISHATVPLATSEAFGSFTASSDGKNVSKDDALATLCKFT